MKKIQEKTLELKLVSSTKNKRFEIKTPFPTPKLLHAQTREFILDSAKFWAFNVYDYKKLIINQGSDSVVYLK